MNVFLYLNLINICTLDKQPLLTAAAEDRSNGKKSEMFLRFFCMKFALGNKNVFPRP